MKQKWWLCTLMYDYRKAGRLTNPGGFVVQPLIHQIHSRKLLVGVLNIGLIFKPITTKKLGHGSQF
jgi:hypothetical protein